jgi:hypothetical protein
MTSLNWVSRRQIFARIWSRIYLWECCGWLRLLPLLRPTPWTGRSQAPGIAPAMIGTGVHAVMGSGGAPEGVLTAAALRCLNGYMVGRLTGYTDEQRERMPNMGIKDAKKIYTAEDLAPGKNSFEIRTSFARFPVHAKYIGSGCLRPKLQAGSPYKTRPSANSGLLPLLPGFASPHTIRPPPG